MHTEDCLIGIYNQISINVEREPASGSTLVYLDFDFQVGQINHIDLIFRALRLMLAIKGKCVEQTSKDTSCGIGKNI